MTPEILHEWVLGVTPDAQLARAVSDELVARYTEPHRRWHGLNHLDMLNNIPEFLRRQANPKLHELADFLESEKGYVRNNPTGR